MASETAKLLRTSVRIKGEVYGATPDADGPIGGGLGYRRAITTGDFLPTNVDELMDALAKAKSGQVVFLKGSLRFDMTERIHIEKTVIEVGAGVTLASDRGVGRSKGAMIFSDTFATLPLMQVMGDGVRLSGIRLRGPDPERRMEHHERCLVRGKAAGKQFDHDYYYKFPVSEGVRCDHASMEIDNCELSAFSHGGVYFRRGAGHVVHHSFIHHNQYNGLGYGIVIDKSFMAAHHNLFNYNRHSIAATGAPGSGYEAHNNVEIGASLSHCFDMHGGADRGDGTNIAGDWMKVHHNTFRPRNAKAVVVRGVPVERAEVYRNWFSQTTRDGAIHGGERTEVRGNAFGRERPKVVE